MSEQPPRRPGDDDVDARFADIVSRWDLDNSPARPESGPRDDVAGSDAAPTTRQAGSDPRHDATQPPTRPDSGRDQTLDPHTVFGRRETTHESSSTGAETPPPGWRVHVPPPEPEEDFVPAPVAPLPRGDLTFWGAMVGLVTGPLWLLYLVVFHRDDGHVPMVSAILVTVAGFALMVWRLPTRHPQEEDDDGAVV